MSGQAQLGVAVMPLSRRNGIFIQIHALMWSWLATTYRHGFTFAKWKHPFSLPQRLYKKARLESATKLFFLGFLKSSPGIR